MKKRYPGTLSIGDNNTVIALSETEVGKVFTIDTRSDIGSEAEKMKFANSINSLIVGFIRLDELNEDTELLVMERLFPMDFRAYEFEKRELLLDVFEDELHGLHRGGFVHRDLRRPSDMPGERFDNIFLTNRGLRLIDVGISALKHQVGDRLFSRFVEQELKELEIFRAFFLSR
jgi:serine/threonine protein kinase